MLALFGKKNYKAFDICLNMDLAESTGGLFNKY